jgi:transposase
LERLRLATLDTIQCTTCDGITTVAMDMWEPYSQFTREHLPRADAKIVFDKLQSSNICTTPSTKARKNILPLVRGIRGRRRQLVRKRREAGLDTRALIILHAAVGKGIAQRGLPTR